MTVALNWNRLDAMNELREMARAEVPLTPEKLELRERLESSFMEFLPWAWRLVCNDPLKMENYVQGIVIHLEALARLEIRNLMIHVAPRMGKTLICSVIYDAWRWARDPGLRVFSSSFSDQLCKEDARLTREILVHPEYQELWGHKVQLAKDQNEKGCYVLTSGGRRTVIIYGTGGQGTGGDLLRLDDPQCAADMGSPTDLEKDYRWFYSTWDRRGNNPATVCHLIDMQRLGPFDIANRLRVDDPNRWEVLGVELQRSARSEIRYYHKRDDGTIEVIQLPRLDTVLSRDGRYIDPREPGEWMSDRVNVAKMETFKRIAPAEYQAQMEQAPVQAHVAGVKIYGFDRARHVRRFASLFGVATLQEAVAAARRQGWKFGLGWDHGIGARREWCHVVAYHDQLCKAWVIGTYHNQKRTGVLQDARAVKSLLNQLGIHIREISISIGDVGTIGKTSDGDAGRNTNVELATICEPGSDIPILGFSTHLPDKRGGSVTTGCDRINSAFVSDGLFIDATCEPLASALEQWIGGEEYKDAVDAYRYVMYWILTQWFASLPGNSGMR